jgi:hypothetical protein
LQSDFVVSYLDDITIIGSHSIVNDDLRSLSVASNLLGLRRNSKKCELTFMDPSSAVPLFTDILPELKLVTKENATLLGGSLGERSALEQFVKLERSAQVLASNLRQLDRHSALYLIKNCFSMPKYMYSLRVSPLFRHPDRLLQLDNCWRSILEEVCNTMMDDSQWSQAILPIRLGGLGIGSASLLGSASFISSVHASSPLVQKIVSSPNLQHPHLEAAMAIWSSKCNGSTPTEIGRAHV